MEVPVVEEHEKYPQSKGSEDPDESRDLIPDLVMQSKIPAESEDRVLSESNRVESRVLVASGFVSDGNQANEVNRSDHHVQHVLPVWPAPSGPGIITEVGPLVHDPHGHDTPVTYGHRKDPEAEARGEEGDGSDARADGQESPHEL